MRSRISILVCAFSVLIAVGSSEAATRTVCASGCAYTDLQLALNDAVYGDVILLRAGQTYVGHFTLPVKSGTGWIEIRSDAAASSLPAAGQRLVPSNKGGTTSRSLLPRIVGRGGQYKTTPLLRARGGARGYIVRFVEFDGTANVGYETLIQLGEDTTATPPSDIVLDRVYVHGHPTKGQKRGISVNGVRLSILNSYIDDVMSTNADSQAIGGWNGAGPVTIENNFLEASGENIMFGGAAPAISNLIPSDIVIRRNHIYKPTAWRNDILAAPTGVTAAAKTSGRLAAGKHFFKVVAVMAAGGGGNAVSKPSVEVSATVAASGAATLTWKAVTGADKYRIYRGTAAGAQKVYLETPSGGTSFTYTGASEVAGTPPTNGTKWVVKNLLELKNAQRVKIEGNVIENIWQAAQTGYAIVLTPRNPGGTAPWTVVRDVSFVGNIVRHAAGIFNIAGRDDKNVTQRTDRITIRNNLFEDIDSAKYGASAKPILVGGGGPSNVVIDRNTLVHKGSVILHAYGEKMSGFVYTNNNAQHFTYGIFGDGARAGLLTLSTYFPAAVVKCNVFAGGPASSYPTPNAFPTTAEWLASFVSPSTGDYRLKSGSVVANLTCGGVGPGADFAALTGATSGTSTASAAPAPAPAPEPAPAPAPAPGNVAPVASAGGPYAAAVNGALITDGSASRDSDGTIVGYEWSWGDEVLVRAADVPASAIKGTEWVRTAASDAAGGIVLHNPDKGAAKRATALAAPTSYVEIKVPVAAGVPYQLWMRMRAGNDAFGNDSLFVQFSGATNAQGASVAKIGTTAALAVVLEEGNGAGLGGWGWNDGGYGTIGAPIYFATSGVQTIRIQQREDGILWDQLVLSTSAYATKAPGPTQGDATLLDADFGRSSGIAATHKYLRAGTYPIVLTVVDDKGAKGTAATSATIR